METERIVITFNKDGTFRGASAEGWDNMPVPLDPKALEAFAPKINLTSAEALEEKTTEHAEALAAKELELTRATHIKDAIIAAANDPNVDTEAAVVAILEADAKPERDKEQDAIRAQIAELEAKLDP